MKPKYVKASRYSIRCSCHKLNLAYCKSGIILIHSPCIVKGRKGIMCIDCSLIAQLMILLVIDAKLFLVQVS